MHKIVKIILIVIGLIGTILWFQLPSMDVPPAEAVNNGSMGLMFIIAYLLLGIAVVVTILYGLMNLFTSKGGLKKALFSIGGLLVILVISYVLAKGTNVDMAAMAKNGVPTTEGEVKMIGMGLNMFFILAVIAVGSMLYGGIKKMISK